jgi:hypothetical protein
MQAHTPRQLEMLRIMGIDVWRRPPVPAPAGEAPAEDGGAGDGWVAEASEYRALGRGRANDVLVICPQDVVDMPPDTPAGRLLEAILRSLGTTPGDATFAAPAEPAPAETMTLGALVDAVSPRLTLVLGQNARQSSHSPPGASSPADGTPVVFAGDLQSLMRQPESKAALWRAIVAAAIVD